MTILESAQVALLWYLTITLIAALAYPLLFQVTRFLPDRGLTLARPAGLLILFLPFWTVGHITGVSLGPWTIGLVALSLGVAIWLYAIHQGAVIPFIRDQWRRLALIEGATLIIMTAILIVLGFNPDISGTEKPMELAFLNSVMAQQSIPTPDPWFAGEMINYYYLGYVILGGTGILTGIPGEVVFNLSLATIAAMSVIAAGGLTANLVERAGGSNRAIIGSALLTGYLLGFAGNLHAISQVVSRGRDAIQDSWWGGFGWQSSRVIEDTGFEGGGTRTVITEFPAFSWILGDLHPHVIAYPWMLLAVGLVANLFLALRANPEPRVVLLPAAGAGVAIGALYALNTWDIAILLLLVAVIALLAFLTLPMRQWLLLFVTIGGGLLIAALPFAVRYDAPTPTGADKSLIEFLVFWNLLGYVAWDRTSFADLLTHWGAFVFLLALLSLFSLYTFRAELRNRPLLTTCIVAAILTVALITSTPALLVFAIASSGIALLAVRRETDQSDRFAAILILVALLTLTAIEFVFLQDPFGDRMNTVFKFGFQAWALLAIGIGALAPGILKIARRSIPASTVQIHTVAAIALAVLIVSTAAYSPVSAYRWTNGFHDWRGLDGIEYIEQWNPDEQAALSWLRQHRDEVSVVVEAPGCAYGSDNGIPHNRVSIITGIPTIIGWEGHQAQWRRGQPDRLGEFAERREMMNLAYEDPAAAETFLREMDVTHVFFGTHEQLGYATCEAGPPYPSDTPQRLEEAGWMLVHQSGDILIYEIPHLNAEN